MPQKKLKPLSDKERLFVTEYLIDLNATRAYRAVWPDTSYGSARTQSARLLAKVHIKAEVRAAQADRRRRTRVTADKVVRELGRIAFADLVDLFNDDGSLRSIREVPLETRRAIQSIEVRRHQPATDSDRDPQTIVRIKMEPKSPALEKLCKYLGLIQEIPALETILAQIPEPLREQIREALAATVSSKRDPANDDSQEEA